MIDVEKVKVLLLEEEYPYFTEDTLESMCSMYDDINELCYIACTMKAKVDKIKIGPIEIASNADMWNNLANVFYKKYEASIKANSQNSKSLTGMCARRADEY
ncbi:hypothetical protein [Terrisporobacter muris]|uniref:Uncharacterized protein n=1 Tax=Terrisporobacter muris TaxID=2963284 RepID=A0A9X2S011_9FIRM|nr:hypothetical protein [Terrisporobacter muris]MCR1821295.1 hypothetical protein [Terrisporobacter muris]